MKVLEQVRSLQPGNACPRVSDTVLTPQQFDKAMNDALGSSVETTASIKARARKARSLVGAFPHARPSALCYQGHLDTYRFVDNVWTFFLENATVTFTLGGQSDAVTVDKAKIIAVAAT